MTDSGKHTEKDIAELAKRGDRGVMRLLYDSYVGYMSAVCARYLPDENDRKDVLQETFIKIFTSIRRFEYRGEGSLKAWMLRITINEALKFIKRSETYSFIDRDEQLPDTPEEPEVESIPDDTMNDMILSLPPGYRTVFNLYVFENKSHKEISRMLNIGESSSASQYSRAKAMLSRKIKEYKRTHQTD